MKLQFLGQQQMNLIAGHYYRARFLMQASSCPIPNTQLAQVKTILNGLGSARTESDWESWTTSRTTGPGWTVLKIPDPSYFDGFPPSPWPANMREVPPALNPSGLCPVWAWAKAKQNVTISPEAFRGALTPLGLLNFWDETSGQRLYDAPIASLVPGQILPGSRTQIAPGPGMSLVPGGGTTSPGQPPIGPIIPGGGATSPLPGGGGATSPGQPPIGPIVPGGGGTEPPPPQGGGGGTTPIASEKKTSLLKIGVAVAAAGGLIWFFTR